MIPSLSFSSLRTPILAMPTKSIAWIAIPIISSALLSTAQAGLASYTACVATCPAMAMAAPPGLFQYTFQACMASCTWMLSPTCP